MAVLTHEEGRMKNQEAMMEMEVGRRASLFHSSYFILHSSRWLLLFALTFAVQLSHAQVSREYQLKAVFLYNFAQFTEWPTNSFSDQNSPIVIGILGNDPFGRVLDKTVEDETVHGRKLVIE